MNKPKYHYSIRFSHYNIYREDADGSATKIDDRMNEEEARKEVYRLNGWEYKQKTKRINNEQSY